MYKVYEVEGGYQIFWCPEAPIHFSNRVPYDGRVYPQRQGAYRKAKQLNEALEKKQGNRQEEKAVA